MKQFHFATSLLFLLFCIGGCEQKNSTIATDEEIQAHVEEFGNQRLDPEADLGERDTGFE